MTHYPDLWILPEDHPPSPYAFPVPVQRDDRWGDGRLPEGLHLAAVGWLEDKVPVEGETPAAVVQRLWQAHEELRYLIDGTHGWHDCLLCSGEDAWYPDGMIGPVVHWGEVERRIRGYGHFLIKLEGTVYMAPVLILHYILDHRYRPPDEFNRAVENGEILTKDDLVWSEPSPPPS